jgi:V8-like Glu-specific endopeptidase
MKKILLALVFVSLLFTSNSQTLPPGYGMHQSELLALNKIELPLLNSDSLVEQAQERDKMGKMSMYGAIHYVDMDAESHGQWKTDVNGNMIWQFKFKSEGALAMALLFDDFYLPEGASYYIYSADRSWFEGPFDFTENQASGRYRSMDAYGDEAIFEYFQPAGVVGSPHLGIYGVIHYYRFIQDPRADQRGGQSAACQVDVNCPEGAEWADQRQSVVRLSLVSSEGVGNCTGSMVNNTSYDCKNYVLTAMHCTENSSTANLDVSTIRFNFQRANCGSGSGPSSQQKVGLILRADSNDNGGVQGSDFALLEMDDTIPSSWNPFYAGWDATTTAPAIITGNIRGIGIHHPNGDVKKISAASTVTNGNWVAPGNHWRVVWTETETNWGVTEGGSSGSPLYNKDKRIIGTLTGGGSFCNAQTASDYYGKMDRHFYGNPNPANEDLVDWLDAAGTGLTAINGAYRNNALSSPCTPAAITPVNELVFEDVLIYPTIASDIITISTSKVEMIKEIRIFDASGRVVDTFNLNSEQQNVSVRQLNTGVYFISFIANDGNFLTKKFTVSK